jgi:hypothetical protein
MLGDDLRSAKYARYPVLFGADSIYWYRGILRKKRLAITNGSQKTTDDQKILALLLHHGADVLAPGGQKAL